MRFFLMGLVLGACLMLTGCGGHGGGGGGGGGSPMPSPPEPPIALVSRKGLYFGYFGDDDAQIDETADHTNILFEPFWYGGVPGAIARMQKAKLPTILAIDKQLFTDTSPRYYRQSNEAKLQLTEVFDQLLAGGVLQYVVALYVIDEPDIPSVDLQPDVIKLACLDCRQVALNYAELANVKLAVTYASYDWRAIGSFDWVGIDDYGAAAGVLTSKVPALLAALSSTQSMHLIPGGADPWKQDPLPFLEYAQQHPAVIAILPFIWIDHYGYGPNLGVRSNGMAPYYRAVGKAIKEA